MKLLGWMHRKFRQNSSDGFKDFTNAQSGKCLSGLASLDYKTRPLTTAPLRPPARDLGLFAATGDDEGEHFDSSSGADPDVATLFSGFLTIGTLGSAAIPEHPSESAEEDEDDGGDEIPFGAATPKFWTPVVEAIAEKADEATTETHLMVVSAELEKVLAEGRISWPSGKSSGAEECPLQGYLFGSSVEVGETRRDRRASLGELFLRSKMEEEAVGGGASEGKGVLGMGKKTIKRRGEATVGDGGGAGGGYPTAETKFHKILQIFHRKVHPESTLSTKKSSKPIKQEVRETVPQERGNHSSSTDGGHALADSKRAHKKMGIPCFKCDLKSPSLMVDESGSSRYHELWIKTDADYLVLELYEEQQQLRF